jgi:SAM-dependent methyltransferase
MREEVMPFIPDSLGHIDVGCGDGSFAKKLHSLGKTKKYYNCDKSFSETFLPDILADLDDHNDVCMSFRREFLEANQINLITMLDVIEHLKDPWKALSKISSLALPGTTFVFSIPNASNWRMIKTLIFKDWYYENSGLFDKTHLRFFTLASAVDLVADNLTVRLVTTSNIRPFRLVFYFNLLTLGFLQRFLAIQYIIVARKE